MTWLIRLSSILLISIGVIVLSGAVAIGVAYYRMAPDLPDISALTVTCRIQAGRYRTTPAGRQHHHHAGGT